MALDSGSIMQSVAQLAEFTGRSEEECIALLEISNGNYDAAANLALDGAIFAPIPPTSSAAAAPREVTEPLRISLLEELNQNLVSDAAPHVPQRPRTAQTNALILKPVAWIVSLLSSLLGSILGPAPSDPYNPQKAATKFTSQLAQVAPSALEFVHESYHQTLLDAKNNLRYMLVVVLAWQHEDAGLAKCLENDSLKQLVQRHNLVCWGGSLDSSEAYQVVLGFGATKYPFIALVGPSPKTPQSNIIVMESLLKRPLAAFDGAEDLVHSLEEKLVAHDPKVQALRLDREQNELDRAMRSQQDEAYEESLRRDRARAEERQRQEEQERQQQEALAQQEQAKEQSAAALEVWKQVKAHEFSTRQLEGATCRVQFRTSQGRVVAKFDENDTLETLYEYVLSLESGSAQSGAPALGNTGESPGTAATTAPPNFKPKYHFKLVSPPRVVLEPSAKPVKEVPEIWPSGALVVDDL